MISPCISLLRKLALDVNSTLGAKLGSKHHTPNLDKDLLALRQSLMGHNIFGIEPGRVIDRAKPETGVVPNIVNVGLNMLPGPLDDYNRAFKNLQERRRLQPLTDDLPAAYAAGSESPRAPSTAPSTPRVRDGVITGDEALSTPQVRACT